MALNKVAPTRKLRDLQKEMDRWTRRYGSQNKLAEAAGIPHSQISRIYNGQIRLSPKMAYQLALVTSVTTLGWLMASARFEARRLPKISPSERSYPDKDRLLVYRPN